MPERPALNQTLTNAARLLVAVYIGALLAGPSPGGFAPKSPDNPPIFNITLGVIIVLIIPWFISGMIAGRRLGVFAGATGFMVLMSSYYSLPLLVLAGPFIIFPMAAGWAGALLASHIKISKTLDGWRYWQTAGVVVLLFFTYTLTIGRGTAVNSLYSKYAKIWPEQKKITTHMAGVYLGVDGITGCEGCGFPDTYYTDPTGLAFLYKVNLD